MIHTLKAVKTACNQLVKNSFPDLPIYGTDTRDGYKRPAFFTEIRMNTFSPGCQYQHSYTFSYIATLFEETHDELLCLNVMGAFSDAFKTKVKVGSRYIPVEDISYEWIGEHSDMLQIAVQFAQVTELSGRTEYGDIAKDIKINEKVKEGE